MIKFHAFFLNFTHIWLPKNTMRPMKSIFSQILQNTCSKMHWIYQTVYSHTTAAGDIIVTWAAYNSGEPIMIHSPYSWYSHLSYNHSITLIEKGYSLFIPSIFLHTIGTKRLPLYIDKPIDSAKIFMRSRNLLGYMLSEHFKYV